MSIRKQDNPKFFKHIEDQNLLRQYDFLTNSIEIGMRNGIDSFDKYFLWQLNTHAVANISQFSGRFREQPIYVGNHIPPHFKEVPHQIDLFLSVIHENWDINPHPTTLAAYALWRLNWVHPFIEGNGRTARAACYYLLCLSHGKLLPGNKIVPERIIEDRQPYYNALSEADKKWEEGHFDVSVLADYLQIKLRDQLNEH